MQENLIYKNTTGIKAPEFAKNVRLTSLKSDVDDLDIDKSKTVPVDLSKISKVVEMVFLKKLYIMN